MGRGGGHTHGLINVFMTTGQTDLEGKILGCCPFDVVNRSWLLPGEYFVISSWTWFHWSLRLNHMEKVIVFSWYIQSKRFVPIRKKVLLAVTEVSRFKIPNRKQHCYAVVISKSNLVKKKKIFNVIFSRIGVVLRKRRGLRLLPLICPVIDVQRGSWKHLLAWNATSYTLVNIQWCKQEFMGCEVRWVPTQWVERAINKYFLSICCLDIKNRWQTGARFRCPHSSKENRH